MLPLRGGICLGVDQRNHPSAPGLPAGRLRVSHAKSMTATDQNPSRLRGAGHATMLTAGVYFRAIHCKMKKIQGFKRWILQHSRERRCRCRPRPPAMIHFNDLQDVCLKKGSIQGQNLALTALSVPNSLDQCRWSPAAPHTQKEI